MSRFFSRQQGLSLMVPLLVLVGLLTPRAARATHALGADMSYVNVAPGMYFVQYRFYRDCGGVAQAPPAAPLQCEATGCDAGATGTVGSFTQSLTLATYGLGNPYCTPVNNSTPCDSAGGGVISVFPNYQVYTYAGVVNLGTGSARECAAWLMSVTVNARPGVANLLNAITTNLYTHVLLNNTPDVADGASPKFSSAGGLQPLMFMCDSTSIRYNSAVTDDDGDSLVYSLQSPLASPTTTVAYAPGYSSQQPVQTLAGAPPLALDATGTLTFTAGSSAPVAPGGNNEENKFVVVIQVDAYRRVNGRVVRTGQVRRELAAVILRCDGSPTVPQIAPGGLTVTMPGQAAYSPAPGAIIPAYPNVPITITTQVTDPGVADSVFVALKPNTLPAAATFSAPAAPGLTTVTFSWTPTAADVRSQPHVVYFDAYDNECPVIQRACFALPIQVVVLRPTGLTTPATARQPLRAAPNPFTTATRLTVTTTAADPADAALRIYDLTGRLVDWLRVPTGAGAHELTWHAPAALPAGVYIARFRGGKSQQAIRLVKE